MILSPIVINQGLLSAVNNDPCRVANLNLGEPVTVNVTGDFSVTRTVNKLTASTRVTVRNIFGDPGMVILLFGENVRLRRGGNLSLRRNTVDIEPDVVVVLYYTGTEWLQLL